MRKKSTKMDERNISIFHKICTILYFVTIAFLAVDLFYREFIIKHEPIDYHDIAMTYTINVIVLLVLLVYFGVINIKVKKIKPIGFLLIYLGLVALGTITNILKYGKLILNNLFINAAIISILVLFFIFIAYLGEKRMEKEISDNDDTKNE